MSRSKWGDDRVGRPSDQPGVALFIENEVPTAGPTYSELLLVLLKGHENGRGFTRGIG